jgi:hypothetical protein
VTATNEFHGQSRHARHDDLERPRFRYVDRHVVTIVVAFFMAVGGYVLGAQWPGGLAMLDILDVARIVIMLVTLITLERLVYLVQLRMRGPWIDAYYGRAEQEFERELAKVTRESGTAVGSSRDVTATV